MRTAERPILCLAAINIAAIKAAAIFMIEGNIFLSPVALLPTIRCSSFPC